MRLRSPAASRTSRGATISTVALVAVLCLLSATNANAALSGSFNASESTTGGAVITGFSSGPFTVGAGGPGFCLGPPNNCGGGSGVSESTSVTGTQVSYTFFGSTNNLGAGSSFTINLTGFTSSIESFTFVSGSLPGGVLTFSHTSNSLTITESTGSSYNAIGGDTIVFSVVAVPEPGSIVLFGTVLIGLTVLVKRCRLPGLPK